MIYPLREVGHRPFSDRELATCRRLVPHLQRALEVGRRLEQSDLARLSAFDALDRLHTAVCILDARGKIALANRHAVEILDERDGLAVRDGMLTTQHATEGRTLARLVAQACGRVPSVKRRRAARSASPDRRDGGRTI